MATPFLICTPAYIRDAVSITATDSAAGTSADNLRDPQPTKIWRAANLTGSRAIEIDLGSSRSVDFIALLYSNVSIGASVDYRAATSQANLDSGYSHQESKIFADFYDSGSYSRRHVINIMSSAHSARWWRLTIPEQASPIEAGCIVLGKSWAPAIEWGSVQGLASGARITETAGGQLVLPAPAIQKQPELQFTMLATSQTEYEELMLPLGRNYASRWPVLALRNADNPYYFQQGAIWGVPDPSAPPAQSALAEWRWRLRLRGMI